VYDETMTSADWYAEMQKSPLVTPGRCKMGKFFSMYYFSTLYECTCIIGRASRPAWVSRGLDRIEVENKAWLNATGCLPWCTHLFGIEELYYSSQLYRSTLLRVKSEVRVSAVA
jgi:hypothetical protein